MTVTVTRLASTAIIIDTTPTSDTFDNLLEAINYAYEYAAPFKGGFTITIELEAGTHAILKKDLYKVYQY